MIDVLEAARIPYQIGGSFASSLHGVPRQTRDADLVAELRSEHVPTLVAELEADFYADAEMMRDVILRRGSFNLIHLTSGFKVDVFVLGAANSTRQSLRVRARYD